jgi:hypothetical protein
MKRDDCPVVADDIALACSTLLTLRMKIDTQGHDRVYAYGRALQHVAGLIASILDIPEADALRARGVGAADLDRIYRDVRASADRCQKFRRPASAASELAEDLTAACTLLQHLYRMRFHEQKASGTQQVEAGDLVERYTTIAMALTELQVESIFRPRAMDQLQAA